MGHAGLWLITVIYLLNKLKCSDLKDCCYKNILSIEDFFAK